MDENNIIKKKKKKNYYHQNNHNKNYYKSKSKEKKKKNLILENSEERENILLFNEESTRLPRPEVIKIEEKKEEKVEIPVIKVEELLKEVNNNNTQIYEEDNDIVPVRKQKKIGKLFSNKVLKYGMGFAVLLVVLIGGSYSYFNYTKVDSRQADIASGDVYVRIVEDETSISLSKMYPRTNEEARARNDNYFDFTVKAKNTSETRSVLYTINIEDGASISGKVRIDPKYIRLDLQEKVNNEYVYILEGVDLKNYSYTGVVPTNTTSEITKEYRLRIWINDGVIISNTDPNATHTITEFNNLFATYNVAINSEDKVIAYSMFAKNADTDTTINFANVSSDTNGKGLYRLLGTENDAFPIYYYRGEVDNNNVVFGGFCWQIVRTTDTGGIKMIYNGEPIISGSGDNISYDCSKSRPMGHIGQIKSTTSLQPYGTSQNLGFYYADDYEIVSASGGMITYRLKSKTNPITRVSVTSSNASTNISTIIANYPYTCKQLTESGTCTTIYKVDSIDSGTNSYVYASENRSSIGKSRFNLINDSISHFGYMNNEIYPYGNTASVDGAYFGHDVEYGDFNNNGTKVYRLINDGNGSVGTTMDATHHYSCDSTSIDGTCSTVRFYYYNAIYISLSNGNKIEDALYKMTGNGDTTVISRNSGYVLNQNDSEIKKILEKWFESYLTNVIDNTKIDYRPYIEDTVYCNDRTYKTPEQLTNTGWSVNGTMSSSSISLASTNKMNTSWYSTTNVPTVACPNKTDRFSTSNNKAHLKYPIGLLNATELVLAGSSGGYTTFYLRTDGDYWTMTPSYYGVGDVLGDRLSVSYGLAIDPYGSLSSIALGADKGVRPVISLKLGVEFEPDGDGTEANPYVVKYN